MSRADALFSICTPACKFACRTAVLLLPGSSYTVFDLLVNCLGGPMIDTWDGDWILSPLPKVWQLTPSLLITSFTQATGLLCLGAHNTTFWVFFFFLPFSQSFCFHMSVAVVIEHLSHCCAFFQLLTPFLYFKCSQCSLAQGIICPCIMVLNAKWLTALVLHKLVQASTCHLSCAWRHTDNLFLNCSLTHAYITECRRNAEQVLVFIGQHKDCMFFR